MDRLWLVAEGGVAPFDGDIDDYRRLVLRGSKSGRERQEAQRPGRDRRRDAAKRREAIAPLRKEIRTIEARIAELQREIAQIDRILASPSTYENADTVTEHARQRSELEANLAHEESQWMAHSTELERRLEKDG